MRAARHVPLGAMPLLLLAAAATFPSSAPLVVDGGAAPAGSANEELAARAASILERRCFECHGPAADLPQGGLELDDRDALLAGGDSGPAVVPGDPDASLLVRAVRWVDPSLEMPPDERLPDEEVETLVRWIAENAEWPPARETDPGALRHFEDRVFPLLEGRCFPCHGPAVEHPKSGFRMAGRAGFLRGGARGPAVVPGDPEASRLVAAVRYGDRDLRMPPEVRLPDEDVAALEAWIAAGAPFPSELEEAAPSAAGGDAGIDVEEGREWWSFRPVERPPVPSVERGEWAANPIDAFVLARLEAAGLAPSPPATPRELVRRASFDLLGLPPTLEEVERFEADERPDAWERLVDELLARPEYGERWARHWLDVVRFAQTNGYERDAEKPKAWRYRDWVIQALNEDLPFDRFVVQQIAGDELPDGGEDELVATGLWRIGAWDDEPDDPELARYDELDDVVRTIGEGFLGVTIGCARCHDHRFDPFEQEDYYGLLAFARSVAPYEDPEYSLESSTLVPLERTPEAIERWRREREAEMERVEVEAREIVRAERRRLALERPGIEATLEVVRESLPDDDRIRLRKLTARAQELPTSYAGDLTWALAVREVGPEPVPTRLLARGLPSLPGPEVPPRFPRVLCPSDEDAAHSPPEPTARSTGLRLRLAEWIASSENPLTARVIANRVWHHHFGRGIVATPNDFGRAGLPPTHPELLDWLASELVARGWSLKELHHLVLTSATWRQSSRTLDDRAVRVDPENDLLWRQRRRRLEAEAIRDSMLAVTGELRDERGSRGFFPAIPKEAMSGMSRPGAGWEPDGEEARARRSVYAFVKRGMVPPFFTVHDSPSCSLPTGSRPTTTTATQALTLLNGGFAARRAAALARSAAGEAGPEPAARLSRAFELALARPPEPEELDLLARHLAELEAHFEGRPEALVLEPLVPRRIAFDFHERLGGGDVLRGPREGWELLRGAWGGSYNGTIEMDPLRGPAALWRGTRLSDGLVEARLSVGRGCELVSLLVRAEPQGDVVGGIEVALLPPDGAAEIRLHGDGEEAPRILARAPDVALPPDRELVLRVALDGERVAATLDGEPLLEASDPSLPREGFVGAMVRGDALPVHRLSVTAGDAEVVASSGSGAPPALRALEAVCLEILNLNEFVYVD